MNRKDAIEEIRGRWKELYPADKSGKGIICPLPGCGNGSGQDGDGIRENPKRPGTLHCFKCHFNGSIFDLIQKERGITFQEALTEAARALNIMIDEETRPQNSPRIENKNNSQGTNQGNGETQNKARRRAKRNFTKEYAEWAERITEAAAIEYNNSRGISLETLRQHGIGYNAQANPAGWKYPFPGIVFPCSDDFYLVRDIRPDRKAKYVKLPVNDDEGEESHYFNEKALWSPSAGAVFLCEGPYDALSFTEAGATAVSLNGTGHERLLSMLDKRPTRATFILSFDNDEAGRRATRNVDAGLTRLNIPHIIRNVYGEYNDANEALCKGKAAFIRAVKQAVQEVTKPDNTTDYIDKLFDSEIETFSAQERKTGFKSLDENAGGGIYSGLYVLGAGTSMGKTTFLLQLADQMAGDGQDVIYFSLEQSRLELVTKSLARIINQKYGRKRLDSLSIRKNVADKNLVAEAAAEYTRRIGNRLSIIEANFKCDVDMIERITAKYIEENGVRPLVIIDYLQVLLPTAEMKKKGGTNKEMVDLTINAVKRMTRELNIPVIAIASINRKNYLMDFDFESLKESGSLEYTADVVWGLQLQCIHEKVFNGTSDNAKRERFEQEKKKSPRKMELVCRKNRYGIANYTCLFDYYPDQDVFKEKEQTEYLPPM